MEKEIIKPTKGEEDEKREPYYGSTIIVWIRPKPGKYCEFSITVGEAKKNLIIQSNVFQEMLEAISMIAEQIQKANKKNELDVS